MAQKHWSSLPAAASKFQNSLIRQHYQWCINDSESIWGIVKLTWSMPIFIEACTINLCQYLIISHKSKWWILYLLHSLGYLFNNCCPRHYLWTKYNVRIYINPSYSVYSKKLACHYCPWSWDAYLWFVAYSSLIWFFLSLFLFLILDRRPIRPTPKCTEKKEKMRPHRGEAGPLGRKTPPHKLTHIIPWASLDSSCI